MRHQTPAGRPTREPFTLAVCTSCGADVAPQLMNLLGHVVRQCPHGVLVTTECLLGPITCATRPAADGAMLLLQPCSEDRTPNAPTHWLGPITELTDARLICEWIRRGEWDVRRLPTRLRAEATLHRSSMRN